MSGVAFWLFVLATLCIAAPLTEPRDPGMSVGRWLLTAYGFRGQK